MGFFRQKEWSGFPFPPSGVLPNPDMEPRSLALAGKFFTTEPGPCWLSILNITVGMNRKKRIVREFRINRYTPLSFCFFNVAFISVVLCKKVGLPWWLSSKESACNAWATGFIPGSGRSPGGGHGTPLQYSCLENSMDRGAWQAYTPQGHKESDTTEVAAQHSMYKGKAVR